MRIKSMIATFGCLDRARLEPGEGFNLIQAPNEGGKSTWCAFLKAMFYGIDTRDRDRKGYLADKNRYHIEMKKTIEKTPGLDMKQGEVVDILLKDGCACGVLTKTNTYYGAKAVILATGTFLGGKIFIGSLPPMLRGIGI